MRKSTKLSRPDPGRVHARDAGEQPSMHRRRLGLQSARGANLAQPEKARRASSSDRKTPKTSHS